MIITVIINVYILKSINRVYGFTFIINRILLTLVHVYLRTHHGGGWERFDGILIALISCGTHITVLGIAMFPLEVLLIMAL